MGASSFFFLRLQLLREEEYFLCPARTQKLALVHFRSVSGSTLRSLLLAIPCCSLPEARTRQSVFRSEAILRQVTMAGLALVADSDVMLVPQISFRE